LNACAHIVRVLRMIDGYGGILMEQYVQ
jgi:hypothetical protein